MRIHASSIWLLPLALFAAPVTAQTSKVIGTVSMSNGRRAPGASVNVRCGGVAATRFTDASGSFAVEDVPVGECQVIVVTTALRVVVRTVTVNGDVPAIVTVVLSPAAVNTPRSASRSAAPDRMALQVNGGGEGS